MLVLIAVTLPLVVFMVAFAVDVAWMQLVRTELRTQAATVVMLALLLRGSITLLRVVETPVLPVSAYMPHAIDVTRDQVINPNRTGAAQLVSEHQLNTLPTVTLPAELDRVLRMSRDRHLPLVEAQVVPQVASLEILRGDLPAAERSIESATRCWHRIEFGGDEPGAGMRTILLWLLRREQGRVPTRRVIPDPAGPQCGCPRGRSHLSGHAG